MSHAPRPTPHAPQAVTANFKDEGDAVLLLGTTREELGGSEYLAVIHGKKAGRPPRVDLKAERALQRFMVEAASLGWLKSAHDCSDGGLAVALAESCIMEPDRLIGATIQFGVHSSRFVGTMNHEPRTMNLRTDALLFGESAGRIVISCARHHIEPLEQLATRHRVPARLIGRVGGSYLSIDPWMQEPVDTVSDAWHSGLSTALGVRG